MPKNTRVTLYCTRCGAPAEREFVQAIDDQDTCAKCGGACWRPADAPPVVKFDLTDADRAFLRELEILPDSK